MQGLIHPLRWLEKNIKLDLDVFNRWDWPGMIGIMHALFTRRGISIVILGSAQSFKTLTSSLWSFYSRIMFSGNIGWYSKSGDLAKKTAEEKINPFWDQVKKVYYLVPESKRTILKKVLVDNYFDIFSQKTAGDRVQKTLMEVDYDEAWLFEPGNISEIQKRRGGKHSEGLYREIYSSTGGVKGCDFHIYSKSATCYRWMPPCDHCGLPMAYAIFPRKPVSLEKAEQEGLNGVIVEVDGKQMFRAWGGLRFLTGEDVWNLDDTLNTVKLHASVFYQCEHCGHEHKYDARSRDERNRRAVELYLKVYGYDGELKSAPERWFGYWKVKDGKRNLIEFHYNALMHFSHLELAEEWAYALKARARGEWEGTERFYRERGAMHYSPKEHLRERTRKSSSVGDYKMADPSKPFDVVEWWPESKDALRRMVEMTQDVQKNHYWVRIRVWIQTKRGLRSRLIWCGQTFSTDENKRLQTHFEALSHGGNFLYDDFGRVVFGEPGCTTMIDGNYDVENQVKQSAGRNDWVVFRGRQPGGKMHRNLFYHQADNTYRLYGELKLVDAFVGTVLEGSQDFPLVAEIQYSAEQCLNILEDFRALGGADPVWSYPQDVPEFYLNHLDSWVRVPGERRDGSESWNWIKQGPHDHLLDCEKMGIAIVSMAGWIGSTGGIMNVGVSELEDVERGNPERVDGV